MAVLILLIVVGGVALIGAGWRCCERYPQHDGKLLQVVAVVSVILYLLA
jgi:hypothetical protein